ncbi:hypothetical protein ACVMVB_09295 [Stenotrophomonas maltophilia]
MTLPHKLEVNQSIDVIDVGAMDEAPRRDSGSNASWQLQAATTCVETEKTTAPKGRGRGASTARMDQKRWVYFM